MGLRENETYISTTTPFTKKKIQVHTPMLSQRYWVFMHSDRWKGCQSSLKTFVSPMPPPCNQFPTLQAKQLRTE